MRKLLLRPPDRTKVVITQLLVGLTVALAGAPLERTPGARVGPIVCDTVDLELRFFKGAFGMMLPGVHSALELVRLKSREDLDNLAFALQTAVSEMSA